MYWVNEEEEVLKNGTNQLFKTIHNWRTPKLFDRLKYESKVKIVEE
jgi:hypothetical protein